MFHETHNLAGYVEGTLSPEAFARTERHLESCGRCRSALADMRAAHRVLGAAGQAGPEPRYDPDLWSRVHAQIARPTARPAVRTRWAFATGGFALAGAAVWLVVMNYAPIDGPVLTGKQLPATPGAPGVSQKSKAEEKTRLAVVPAPNSDNSAPEASSVGAARPIPEPRSVAIVPPPLPGSRDEAAPMKKELLAGLPDGVSRDRAFGGSIATPPPAELNGDLKLKRGLDTIDKTASTGAVTTYYAGTPSATNADATSKPSVALSAAPRARGMATESATTDGTGLEIISDEAPEQPASVGVKSQVGERPPMAKLGPGISPPRAGAGTPMFRSTPITNGTPTMEGLRLLSKANDAFSRGMNNLAYQYYADASTAGLDSAQARLADVRRGDIALQANDTTNAIKFFRAALVKAKDASTLTKLGDAYEKSGNAKDAKAAFKEALTLSPGYAPAREGCERVKGN